MEEAFVSQAGFGWHPLYMWVHRDIYIYMLYYYYFKSNLAIKIRIYEIYAINIG
jgi:hypothetical protein